MLKNSLLFMALILMQDRGAPPPPVPPVPGQTQGGGRGGQVIINAPPNINGLPIQLGPNVVFGPGGPLDQPFQVQQQQQLPPGTATVDGIVIVMGTSDPVPGATVEMRMATCGRTGGQNMTTTSGPDGKFSFKQVRAGSWCIGAAKVGGALAPAEYRQRGYKSWGETVTIADNQQLQDIKLMMPRTGSISGRVLDSDGEPMGHARVQAMEAFYQDGRKRLYTLNIVQANDQGEFSLFWLPPGEYYVSAAAEDPMRQNLMFSVSPPGIGGHRSDSLPPVVTRKNLADGGVIEDVYKPVYYGGGPDPQRASKIDVRPGSSNVIELSFAGAQVRSFHVRGRVMNGVTAQPAEGAQIRLIPRDWTATAVVPFGSADKNGNFDVSGVPPGSYALYASASTRDPNAPTQATIQGLDQATIQQLLSQGVNLGGALPIGVHLPIEIGNQNVENISLNLLPGGTLMGEFVFEGKLATDLSPQQKSSFRVNLVREPEIPGASLGGASNGAIAANSVDNSFRLPSIFPGDFRVMISPFVSPFSWAPSQPTVLGGYVKSIRYGNADVLNDGLHLNSNNPDQRLQITLATGGTLSGAVTNDRNEPVPNVKVALVPDFIYRKRNEFYRNVTTTSAGSFNLQGIPPGDYKIFAWEDIADGAWQDPDILRDFETRGKVVRISEGAQATVEVVVIPGARQ